MWKVKHLAAALEKVRGIGRQRWRQWLGNRSQELTDVAKLSMHFTCISTPRIQRRINCTPTFLKKEDTKQTWQIILKASTESPVWTLSERRKEKAELREEQTELFRLLPSRHHELEQEAGSSGADDKMSHVDKELKTLTSHSNILKKGGKKSFLLLKTDSVPWTKSSWSWVRVWEDLVISRQEAADLRQLNRSLSFSSGSPCTWWAGWHICPRPWALAATPFETGRSHNLPLRVSLWMPSLLLPPCQIQSFQWIQRGHLWQVDFLFLSFLQKAWITPVYHPATLQKHKLAFYQEALLLALPGGQRHLKAKMEGSYLWGGSH